MVQVMNPIPANEGEFYFIESPVQCSILILSLLNCVSGDTVWKTFDGLGSDTR